MPGRDGYMATFHVMGPHAKTSKLGYMGDDILSALNSCLIYNANILVVCYDRHYQHNKLLKKDSRYGEEFRKNNRRNSI
jgi:hypothetical protein